MCWLMYSWWKNISQSWSFLTNPCIYSIPNSMTSGCLASDCRNSIYSFTLHFYHLLSTVLCIEFITKNLRNKYNQESCWVFSWFELLIDEWTDENNNKTSTEWWKQKRERHSITGMLEMFEKLGFMGILISFFISCLFFFSSHSPPLSLSSLLSLSAAHQCGCSSVMTPTVAGPL